MTPRVTRSAVLAVIRERFPTDTFSTPDVARILDVSDQAARVSIGWLVAAGAVEVAGRERCSNGSKFYRATYRWTGREEVSRMHQSKADRRADRVEVKADSRATAAYWLSRRW